MGQHKELVERVQKAVSSGKVEEVLSASREAIMAKLDKERGHTVTDHSIFDAHARRYEDEYFEDISHGPALPNYSPRCFPEAFPKPRGAEPVYRSPWRRRTHWDH